MKKLNKAQKIIFVLGVLGVSVSIYGKLDGWEHHDYFIPFYAGMSFMWIAFLDAKEKCFNPFKRKRTNKFGRT